MLTRFPDSLVGNGTHEHPAEKYLASLRSAQSQRAMRTALNNLAVLNGIKPAVRVGRNELGRETKRDMTYLGCDWAGLTPRQVAKLRARLIELYQPSSVNKILSALRGVLKAAYDLQLMSAEDYLRAVQVKGVKAQPKPAGRDLSEADVRALIKICKADKTAAGVRDAAMIGLWYTCGIRRSELVRLALDDFDCTSGKLLIRGNQSRKSRTVYVPTAIVG